MLDKIKNFFVSLYLYVVRYPLGILLFALTITFLAFMLFFRKKSLSDLNVGGILGWALGTTKQEEGKVDKGQVYVTNPGGDKPEVKTPAVILPTSDNPFRDKEKIQIKTEDGEIREVRLPKGVKDKDVVEVIEIAPKPGGVTKVLVEKKPSITITDEDLKSLLVIFTLLISLVIPSDAITQTCPPGYKCLKEDQAARLLEALNEFKCMQEALKVNEVTLELSPLQIIVDESSNVYIPGEQTALLNWCSYRLRFTVPLTATVARRLPPPPPTYGLRFRFRLGALATYPTEDSSMSLNLVEPYLGLESFYWRLAHLNTHVGLRSGGLGVGIDLTKNLDLNVAVAVRWQGFSLTPAIGLSLALY